MAFWKSGDDLFQQGNDHIKRREFAKARKVFEKAVNKGTKDGDMAQALIALLSLEGDLANPARYDNVASVLRSKGDMDFEFGLTDVNAKNLVKECELLGGEFTAYNMARNQNTYAQRGNALIKAATQYQMMMPNDILVIPEIFGGVSQTGIRRAQKLFAEGNEDLAESVVFSDPRKAAEYQQIALNYRQQMGESGEGNRQKIESYSKTASCWFCGRDVTGERIHFFAMSSDVGNMQYKERDESHLNVKSPQGDAIYACRACYSAVSRRADAIANNYHKQAMAEINRVEQNLRAEIRMVQSQVSSIRMSR